MQGLRTQIVACQALILEKISFTSPETIPNRDHSQKGQLFIAFSENSYLGLPLLPFLCVPKIICTDVPNQDF